MTDEPTMELDPGSAIIRGYLHRALAVFVRELHASADAAGGKIGAADIDRALQDFKRPDSPTLAAICRAAWKDCGLLYDAEDRGEDRKASFERLLVWPFAHLLPQGDTADAGEREVTRHIIPGYLAAIEDLIGPLVFGRHQERCRELVRTTRSARGGAFHWDDIYNDPTSQLIVDDVLVLVAQEFADFEEQRDWFIGLVNDAMPAPTNGSGHAAALDDDGFTLIMSALFGHLAQELDSVAGRPRLVERHGEQVIERLRAFVTTLKKC